MLITCPQSCQLDLIKDGGQHYFINVLGNTKVPAPQRTQAAFILSVISNNCRPGQQACLNARMLQICLGQLNEQDSMLRRWVVFALAKFWENYEEAKWAAIKDGAHEKLCSLLQDPVPEVRAAAVYALGTFIGGGHSPEPLSVSNCLILMGFLPNSPLGSTTQPTWTTTRTFCSKPTQQSFCSRKCPANNLEPPHVWRCFFPTRFW